MSNNPANAEELWYTVQAGSYTNQQAAESFYKVLSLKLPPDSLADLRIEYVSSYYTVRAGKFKSSKEIIPLFEKIQALADQPLLLYAYVRPTRVIRPSNNSKSPKHDTVKLRSISVTKETANQQKTLSQNILFYTIQAGSYLKEDDATRQYDTLATNLPPKMRNSLRIEKVGSFFTVRVGKEDKQQMALPLLDAAKEIVHDPIIMHAYIRDTRISKSYSPKQPPPEVSAVSPKLSTVIPQPHKPATAEKARQQPKTKTTAIRQPPNKNPLTKQSSSTQQLPEIKPQELKSDVIVATSNKQAALSPAEYQKKILAKYLGTSHQTKDRAAAQEKAASFPTSENCTTAACHTALQEIKLAHFPVKHAKCLACHKQLTKQHPNKEQEDFQLVTKGAPLCQQCHLSIIQGNVTHPPAAEGNCLKCHAPHGSGNPFLLLVPLENEQELCLECHDSKITDHRYQHGPVGLGKCTFCHNPHAASHQALLREEPKTLCLNCHTEFKKGLRDSPNIHAPVKNKDCQSCHAVHGGPFPNLLTADPHDFCFTCHLDVKKKFDKSRTKHAGLYLEKQCSTCHLAHYSDQKNLLIKGEKELCLTCHGNNSPLKSFSPKNIEKEISNKEYVHAPVAAGQCTSCHDPHGSQFDSLLMGAYPSTFYAPYDPEKYSLCFICHDQNLLSAKKTDDATNFRNGSQNLHFVHVGIERKGRTCNACHNAHASDGPKLINRTGAHFGEWTMSISFNLTETGGSCMPGCHRKMNYDRETPANNSQKNKTVEKYYIDYKSKTSSDRVLPF